MNRNDPVSDGGYQQPSHTGLLKLSDLDGYVGDTVRLMGRNLVPNERYTLVWHSVEGKWGVLEAHEIVGPQYRPRTERIESVQADEDGQFETELEIPEDYGGEHDIELQTTDGERVATATYEIHPWFEIDRTTAPLGETFTVAGYGLGPNKFRNNYQVTWDNGNVGFMTAVMNRGTTAAKIRAVGAVGEHPIEVWRNYRGVPFLQNNTQSPFGSVGGERQSAWTVEVTEPETEPKVSWVDQMWDETPFVEHFPDIDEETDAELSIMPQSGQPGTDTFIEGEGFPADTEVDLVWYTHSGDILYGGSIAAEPRPDMLPTVTTDEDGRFQTEFTIPPTLGSTRPILAEVDGRSVAATGFMIQPKIESFGPTRGPVGTEIEIELSGIGWPMYENAYYFLYDNRPAGYVCGLNEDDGIIRTELKAAGEPGLHFIEAVPALFEVREDELDFELKPHLSHVNNHPMRPLPAMHFTFEVTK